MAISVARRWLIAIASFYGVLIPNALADLEIGRQLALDERCAECHGVDGSLHGNNATTKIAKLAGQHQDYLLKQFQDFREGHRQNDFMAIMSRSLSDDEVEPILAWYASQPVMRGSGVGSSLGESLYISGDPKRGIVACIVCHGANGRGVQKAPAVYPTLELSLIPIVGGQDWHYLEQQLRDWRSGVRHNSVDNLMTDAVKNVTDADISALSDYLSHIQ